MRRRKCYNTWHIIKTVKPKQGIKLDFLKYYNIYKHENINWLQSYYPNMESHLYGMEKASLFFIQASHEFIIFNFHWKVKKT